MPQEAAFCKKHKWSADCRNEQDVRRRRRSKCQGAQERDVNLRLWQVLLCTMMITVRGFKLQTVRWKCTSQSKQISLLVVIFSTLPYPFTPHHLHPIDPCLSSLCKKIFTLIYGYHNVLMSPFQRRRRYILLKSVSYLKMLASGGTDSESRLSLVQGSMAHLVVRYINYTLRYINSK